MEDPKECAWFYHMLEQTGIMQHKMNKKRKGQVC